MAHFAELDDDNKVLRTIVISNEDILDENGNECEDIGIFFCNKLFGGRWIQTSINKKIRHSFAVPGMYYCPDQDVFSYTLPPGPWAKLNENNEWITDFPININTGEEFTHDELAYISYYLRHTKTYKLCPAVLKDPSDEFTSKACITSSYMYPTFDLLMYGKNTAAQALPHKIEGDTLQILLPLQMSKEVDLPPIACIVKARFTVWTDWVIPLFNTHPQSGGRTIHELFRLIIEWAWTHTELGNTELVSKTCHNLLRVMQMPKDVREEILNEVPAQAVERYIKGTYPFVAADEYMDPPMPPLFNEWYTNKVQELTILEKEVIDLSEYPESYPI